jgi:hypothetical protein
VLSGKGLAELDYYVMAQTCAAERKRIGDTEDINPVTDYSNTVKSLHFYVQYIYYKQTHIYIPRLSAAY